MKVIESKTTVLVEPGRYYLGDPCFAIEATRFHDFMSGWNHNDFTMMDGHICLIFTTNGEGLHRGSNDFEYDICSSTIALIPMDLVKDSTDESQGTVIDMEEPFTCEKVVRDDLSGFIRFGNVCITIT